MEGYTLEKTLPVMKSSKIPAHHLIHTFWLSEEGVLGGISLLWQKSRV